MYRDKDEFERQKRELDRTLSRGEVEKPLYESKIKELDKKIQDCRNEEFLKAQGIHGVRYQDGHVAIDLHCLCGFSGVVTKGRNDFKLIGEDKQGFLYFKCSICGKDIQYNKKSGIVKTKKGILGYLLGKFS